MEVFQFKKMGKFLVDLHLRLARNRAKQKQLEKSCCQEGKIAKPELPI